MEKRERADILGCQVDLVTLEQSVDLVKDLVKGNRPAQVITLNAEMVFQAQSEPYLRQIINQADLVTPDGIGIVWGGRQLGYAVPERVAGIDLVQKICARAPREGWKIYLLGAAPGVAEEAAQQLRRTCPGIEICGIQHGYFQNAELPDIIEAMQETAPHIVFVGLGAPKQELWIKEHGPQLGKPVCIGVGGSLDVIAGQKKRAPRWMIRVNLEWLYRLYSEPSRWRRQLVLPKFVLLILKKKIYQSC